MNTPAKIYETKVIAIDGPAGSGCSTTAAELSKATGIDMIPTGKCYRAASMIVAEEIGHAPNADTTDDTIISILDEQRARFRLALSGVYIDDNDVSEKTGTQEHAAGASRISRIKYARKGFTEPACRELVKGLDNKSPLVISEGRDEHRLWIGARRVAFGVFLTAPAELRAKRRHDQNIAEIEGYNGTYNEAYIEVMERDLADASRQIDPMCPSSEFMILTHRTPGLDRQEHLSTRGQYLVDNGLMSSKSVVSIIANVIGIYRQLQKAK